MATTADESGLSTPIAQHIWETRYRWREDTAVLDQTIEDTWLRVAKTLAVNEAKGQQWQQRFYHILEDFHFLPGGRILAGAGTGHRSTLFNCFVMNLMHDDMESIFNALKEGALTMQAGGGIGYDFSTLRPRNWPALASGRIASGPVSFMNIWDAMCATMLSSASRRGAMLASLRCDHPDIELFINAKRKPGYLRHFNLSVQVTDAFMQAVETNQDWPLLFPLENGTSSAADEIQLRDWPGYNQPVACRVSKRIAARELWQQIMQAAYDTAEPGVLFVDRINRLNNLSYREQITTTNPCGEIPLPPYGACNLGSINLTRFVKQPFTGEASLDLESIRNTAASATRLLDNVVDCSLFPLEAQTQQVHGSRRLGLGITGLADTLIMLGLKYDSETARQTAAQIMQTVCYAAYRSSINLAREKGSFPFLDKQAYLQGEFIQSLPADIRQGIEQHGIRNSHLTAIAPTGTISLLAGNVSSGIEPVFEFQQSRRIINHEGQYQDHLLQDYALQLWQQNHPASASLPAAFVTAHTISAEAHIQMQAALQPYVDNAISKTINVKENIPFAEFAGLYKTAWQQALKGCTTFRANPVTGEILTEAPCCDIDQEKQP